MNLNCGPLWLLAFTTGLMSSGHCLAMCGTLAPALAQLNRTNAVTPRAALWLNLGRVIGYVLWGVLIGGSAEGLWLAVPLINLAVWLRVLVGLAMLLLALRLWRQREDRFSRWLGRHLWSIAQATLKPLNNLNYPWSSLATGCVWSLLPCGMIYSMLLVVMAQGSSLQGGFIMAAFGLGTLPALLALTLTGGALGPTMRQAQRLRPVVAALVAIWAVWNLSQALQTLMSH